MPHGRKAMELYNLAEDPGEQADVADKHPQKVASMRDSIAQMVVRGRTTAGAVQANDTDWWSDLSWITEEEYAAAK